MVPPCNQVPALAQHPIVGALIPMGCLDFWAEGNNPHREYLFTYTSVYRRIPLPRKRQKSSRVNVSYMQSTLMAFH